MDIRFFPDFKKWTVRILCHRKNLHIHEIFAKSQQTFTRFQKRTNFERMHEVDSEVDTQGSDLDVLRSAGDESSCALISDGLSHYALPPPAVPDAALPEVVVPEAAAVPAKSAPLTPPSTNPLQPLGRAKLPQVFPAAK